MKRRRGLAQRIADKLLRRVYAPVTAVVSFDQRGRVMDVRLCDTAFAHPRAAPGAKRVWMIVSHPEASCAYLLPHERRCAARLSPARVYVCAEDMPCRAVRLKSGPRCAILGHHHPGEEQSS